MPNTEALALELEDVAKGILDVNAPLNNCSNSLQLERYMRQLESASLNIRQIAKKIKSGK